jgi:hypothetical protein
VDESHETHLGAEGIQARLRDTIYPYAQVAWEVHLGDHAHLSLGAFQPLWFDPVAYAPVVGIGLRFNQISEGFRRR